MMADLCDEKSTRLIAEWMEYEPRRWTFRGYTEQSAQPAQEQPAQAAQLESELEPEPRPKEQPTQPGQPASPPPSGPRTPPWPELAPEAMHGLAGEIVAAVSPQTESDPVAILLQLHTYFGNAVGRGPYFQVEGDKHFTNLFAILVGESSKARKGTSAGRVRQFLEVADSGWLTRRIESGLSSGEGLIWAVRDQITKINKKGDREVEDEGVADKRLLIDEREFFQALTR